MTEKDSQQSDTSIPFEEQKSQVNKNDIVNNENEGEHKRSPSFWDSYRYDMRNASFNQQDSKDMFSLAKSVMRQKNSIIRKGIYEKEFISFSDLLDREVLKIILKKDGKFRQKIELKYIRKFFSTFDIFASMEQYLPNDIMLAFCREIIYVIKQANEVVYSEGDIGRKFYIVIDGKLDVLEKKQKNKTPMKNQTGKRKQSKKLHVKQNNKRLLRTSKVVDILTNGQSFGDIALKHKILRKQTIYCKEACHLAYITRASYNKILLMYRNQKYEAELQRLRKFSLLSNMPKNIIEQLYKHMKKIQYYKHDIIYQEGATSEFLYFILNGQVEVLFLLLILSAFQISKMKKLCFQRHYKVQSQNCIQNFTTNKQIQKYLNCMYDFNFKLTVLTANQNFGSIEFETNPYLKRTQTAKVISLTCTVYKLPYKNPFIKNEFFKNADMRQTLQSSLVKTSTSISKKYYLSKSVDDREIQKQRIPQRYNTIRRYKLSQRYIKERSNDKISQSKAMQNVFLDKEQMKRMIQGIKRKENFSTWKYLNRKEVKKQQINQMKKSLAKSTILFSSYTQTKKLNSFPKQSCSRRKKKIKKFANQMTKFKKQKYEVEQQKKLTNVYERESKRRIKYKDNLGNQNYFI